jgi:hypothetical protein
MNRSGSSVGIKARPRVSWSIAARNPSRTWPRGVAKSCVASISSSSRVAAAGGSGLPPRHGVPEGPVTAYRGAHAASASSASVSINGSAAVAGSARLLNRSAEMRTPRPAAITETTTAAWKPSSRPWAEPSLTV